MTFKILLSLLSLAHMLMMIQHVMGVALSLKVFTGLFHHILEGNTTLALELQENGYFSDQILP